MRGRERRAGGTFSTSCRRALRRRVRRRYVRWDSLHTPHKRAYTRSRIHMCSRSHPQYTKLRVHSAKLLLHLATAHPFTIPLYNIRSIVAVAGAAADNLRTVCLELLRRLLPWRTESVAHCNGVKTMCDAILDPLQKDMAEPLMLAILHVFSNPAARKFMRSHRDFNGLFAAFTDLDVVVGAERSGKWKRSSVALITILRSYTGIILLATDPNGLKGIMNLISDDTVDSATQNAVLAFIKDVFAPCLQTANGGKAADAGDSTHSTMQVSCWRALHTLRHSSSFLTAFSLCSYCVCGLAHTAFLPRLCSRR